MTGLAKIDPRQRAKIRRDICKALVSAGELCLGQLACDLSMHSATVFEFLRELETDGKAEPHPEGGRDPYTEPYRDECPWALKLP